MMCAQTASSTRCFVQSMERWGEADGREVFLYTLTNESGMQLKATNYGATLTDVVTPDRHGSLGSVVIGFDSLPGYTGRHPYFGSTLGRYANRITGARISTAEGEFRLSANRGEHIVHGGSGGFGRRVFRTVGAYAEGDTAAVVFAYDSPDGEEGFPGNLRLTVAYKLTADGCVMIEYEAQTDRETVVNISNHSYFNLSAGRSDVSAHKVRIASAEYLATDSLGAYTGEFLPVAGTRYDFRTATAPGQRGYDVCYRLERGEGLKFAASAIDTVSGRTLEAYTTEPGMQFFLPERDLSAYGGHGGAVHGRFHALCFEMQHFPDSPRNDDFPSTTLRQGETYRQTTVYKFGTSQSYSKRD